MSVRRTNRIMILLYLVLRNRLISATMAMASGFQNTSRLQVSWVCFPLTSLNSFPSRHNSFQVCLGSHSAALLTTVTTVTIFALLVLLTCWRLSPLCLQYNPRYLNKSCEMTNHGYKLFLNIVLVLLHENNIWMRPVRLFQSSLRNWKLIDITLGAKKYLC